MKRNPSRRAFTLIELLVVVAIIVALLAILMPAMNNAIAISEDAVCSAHIGQMGKAMLAYNADHLGKFSPWRKTIEGNHNGSVDDLKKSLIYPYVPSVEIWLCPRLRSVAPNPSSIIRTYVTNWNCGPGDEYDSEQVGSVGQVFNASGFAIFAEENTWAHPAYGGHSINDGELVASAWPTYGASGSDTLATFHRPMTNRYQTGNPWGYMPSNAAEAALNTGMSNVAFVDGHVEFVDTLHTVMVSRNDPKKVLPSQRN